MLARAREGGHASVSVRIEDETLVFEAGSDCGTPDGLLQSSRDRVEALGGELTVRADPGGSTRVAGSLPLSR